MAGRDGPCRSSRRSRPSLIWLSGRRRFSAPNSAAEMLEPAGQVRYFGPYLGGLRVRRAVAALHRILPLRHAADRPGGAEGDLARVRGVAGSERAALAGSAAALLEPQPAEVSGPNRPPAPLAPPG